MDAVEYGIENHFVKLVLKAFQIDYLRLKRPNHQRAIFTLEGDEWQGTLSHLKETFFLDLSIKQPNNEERKPTTSRRDFIKKSFLASSIVIVPRHVLGGTGYTAPSDQLNIASIGCGGKGRPDIINASVKGRERVIALCDIDSFGKHGVTASRKKFPKANFYNDFRQLLAEE